MSKSPFQIIKSRHVTEKARVMEKLHENSSNPCVKACEDPKYVFLVDRHANKKQIADAIEAMYKASGVRVVKVNTIYLKPKRRTVKGKSGFKAAIKKAIVTLLPGQSIEMKV